MRKSMLKRSVVVLMALLMLFSSVPLAGFAQTPSAEQASLSTTGTAVGTNPLAAALADAVNDRTESESKYSILGMELNGLTAEIFCYAPAGSTLVAALYDEDTGRMVASGALTLEAEAEYAEVTLSECDLPEYYYVKVFLLGADHIPLCESLTYERYTRRMQEFYAVTPADFEEEQIVLYLNDSNFSAVNEDVAALTSTESVNVLRSYEGDTYTFASPDAALLALQAGDKLYMETENDLILGEIASSVVNEDGSVTLRVEAPEDPLSYFAYIHVDTAAVKNGGQPGKAPRKAPDADHEHENDPSLTNSLKVNFSYPQDPKEVTLPSDWKKQGVEDETAEVTNDSELKFEFFISGVVKPKMDVEYCYHIEWGPDEYYLNVDLNVSLTGNVGFKVKGTAGLSFNLVKLDIPTSVPGLTVYVQSVFSVSLTGEAKATGEVTVSDTLNYHRESADQSKNQTKAGKPDVEYSFKTEISVTLSAELSVAAGVKVAFGVIKVGGYGKLSAEAVIKPLALCISNQEIGLALFNHDWTCRDGEICAEHDCDFCLNVEVTVSVEAGIEVSWFWKKKEETQTNPDTDEDITVLSLLNKLTGKLSLKGNLLEKNLRASYIDEHWEFEWTDKTDEIVCPHMRFLVKFDVTEKDTGELLPAVPIGIYAVEDKNVKLSTYASIPAHTSVTADLTGTARCYLPAAAYGFTLTGKDYKLVSSTPDNANFRVKNDLVAFNVTAKKSKNIEISVVKEDTIEPLPGLTVYVDLEIFTTDAAGKINTKLFPGEDVTFNVLYKGQRYTFTQTVPVVGNTVVLEIPVKLYAVTGKVVDEETGDPLSGVAITAVPANGEKSVTCATGADGRFEMLLEEDSHSISFSLQKYNGKLLDVIVHTDVDLGTIALEKKTEYEVGDLIEFGSYPQTKIEDAALIKKLNAVFKTWKSYNYYCGTDVISDGLMQPTDDMKFADFFSDGVKYRAVVFSQYRPYRNSFKQTASNSYQDENGYYRNNTYYFRYDPIVWRVLDPEEGLVMAESLLDSQAYQNTVYSPKNGPAWQDSSCTVFASDYVESSIRAWLNNDFYQTAFTDAQKNNLRNDIELNNKSTMQSEYDSAPTKDKIFLPSVEEMSKAAYGFSESINGNDEKRQGKGTDYAKAQGLQVYDETFNQIRYNGFSAWWLRNPSNSYYANTIFITGSLGSGNLDSTFFGVRPACRLIKLKPDRSVSDKLFSAEGNSVKKAAPEIRSFVYTEERYIYTAENTVPGNEYLFTCVKDGTGDSFAAENLLYIDQKTAEGETVTFSYVPREVYTDAVCRVYGRFAGEHSHEYTAEVTKEPTCGEPGVRTYSCECGAGYTEPIPATGEHTWGPWAVTVPASAAQAGEETRTCTVCGKTETREIPAVNEPLPPEGKGLKIRKEQLSGDTLTLTLYAEGCKGLEGGMFTVQYDPSVLKLLPTTDGSKGIFGADAQTLNNADPGAVTVFANADDVFAPDTILCTVIFKNALPTDEPFTLVTWTLQVTDENAASTEITVIPEQAEGVSLTAPLTTTVKLNGAGTHTPDPTYIPGDVDNDKKVTASDARLALRRAVNLESFAVGSPEFLACDVDRDGKVTATDARSILRAAVGLETLN